MASQPLDANVAGESRAASAESNRPISVNTVVIQGKQKSRERETNVNNQPLPATSAFLSRNNPTVEASRAVSVTSSDESVTDSATEQDSLLRGSRRGPSSSIE